MKCIGNERCPDCKGVEVYKRRTKDGRFIQYVADGVIVAQHAVGLRLDICLDIFVKYDQDCVSHVIGDIVYDMKNKMKFIDPYAILKMRRSGK